MKLLKEYSLKYLIITSVSCSLKIVRFFWHDAWYNFYLIWLIQEEKSFICRLYTKKELAGSPFPSSLDSFCKGIGSNPLLVLPLPCICLYGLYGYTFSSSFSCKVWILIIFDLLRFVVTDMYMMNGVQFLCIINYFDTKNCKMWLFVFLMLSYL